MKAMVIDAFGGAEAMYMTEIATPTPAPGEVLIRIRATSINPVEWKIREGGLARLFPCCFPLILGWDAAGTIAAVGEGVTSFSMGDRVWSYCRKPEIQWGT
ncbi:MAG: alcohol dehydrogenase catalytic domain-containing protein, partial [Rhodospirillaceae bacterium]|nr:alcohol dehydrogenase catalytic domain-containing protein [Rhodospirillaceae bacterium]